jgi:hypothetical protein
VIFSRNSHRTGYVLLALGGVLILGPVVQAWRMKVSDSERAELYATGEQVVASLRAHKQRFGVYPRSLTVDAPKSHRKLGAWEYTCVSQCSEFRLSIGYYPWTFYTLSYNSMTEDWDSDS